MVDRSRLGRVAGSALLGVGLLLALTGCAGDALNPNKAAETTTSSEQTTSSPETSAGETTTSETTTAEPSDDATDGPLDPEDEGRKLTLNDFFMPAGNWEEQRYDLAEKKDVQGIATTESGCGDDYAQELE